MSPAASIIAAVAWLIVLTIGGTVVAAERRDVAGRRRRIHLLLGFLVFVSFAPGITRVSLWPFDSWLMFPYLMPHELGDMQVLGVDSTGAEHRIDYRAWQPLSQEELFSMLGGPFLGFDPDVQDSVGAFLLAKANLARADAEAGRTIGYLNRYLGPLTAATHFLHVPHWSNEVPPDPFRQIRFVMVTFAVERGGYAAAQRDSVLFEFPVLP